MYKDRFYLLYLKAACVNQVRKQLYVQEVCFGKAMTQTQWSAAGIKA